MNVETGVLYEGVEEVEKARGRGEPLVYIPNRDIDKVRIMTPDERKAYANRVRNRRKKAKQRRKADRKRRGRK